MEKILDRLLLANWEPFEIITLKFLPDMPIKHCSLNFSHHTLGGYNNGYFSHCRISDEYASSQNCRGRAVIGVKESFGQQRPK